MDKKKKSYAFARDDTYEKIRDDIVMKCMLN